MSEQHNDNSNPEHGEHPRPLLPRIWVGSLADYNNGVLHGEWLDAASEPEELGEAIASLLARSPTPGAEEWAIFDLDDFAGLRLEEHEDLATVTAIARGLQEHGAPFAAWVELVERDVERLPAFEEAYLGRFDSLTAYAEEMLEDLGVRGELDRVLPAHLRPYVHLDAEGLGRDLQLGGDVLVAGGRDGGVWIFYGHV